MHLFCCWCWSTVLRGGRLLSSQAFSVFISFNNHCSAKHNGGCLLWRQDSRVVTSTNALMDHCKCHSMRWPMKFSHPKYSLCLSYLQCFFHTVIQHWFISWGRTFGGNQEGGCLPMFNLMPWDFLKFEVNVEDPKGYALPPPSLCHHLWWLCLGWGTRCTLWFNERVW